MKRNGIFACGFSGGDHFIVFCFHSFAILTYHPMIDFDGNLVNTYIWKIEKGKL